MKRIPIFLAVLALFTATAFAADRPEMKLRLFDVSRIVAAERAEPGPELGPRNIKGSAFWERREEEPVKFFEGDALGDLIRETVFPQAWDMGGDIEYREGGVLLVKAPVEVLDRIGKLLGEMEKAATRRVRCEVELYALPPSRYSEVVAGADPRRIEDSRIRRLESGSVEAPPGLTKSVAITNRVRYVADFDTAVAQGANLGDPVVVADLEGLVVDLYGYPSLDGSKVLLQVRVQSGRFRDPVRTVDLALDEEYLPRPVRPGRRTPYGRIELPEFGGLDVMLTRLIASGGFFTVPVVDGDRFYALRVELETLGGPEYAEAMNLGTTIGRLPSGVYGIPEDEDWIRALMAPGFRPQDGERRPPGGAEEVMDLIARNVEPEQWESGTPAMNVGGPHGLFVHAPAPLLREVHEFLAAWEREALRVVELGVEVHSVTGPVTPGETTELPAGSTLRYAGRLSALPGYRTGMMVGSRAAYVADYDVDVAQDSRIADPIVGLAFDGLVANLRPTLSLDRSRVRAEVEMLIANRAPLEAFDPGAQYLGPIERFDVDRILVRQTVDMAANGSYVIDAGPDPEDPSRRLAVVITNRLP